MKLDPIKRGFDGLAETRYCEEREDGGLAIILQDTDTSFDGSVVAKLSAREIAPGAAFAETWVHLTSKRWFTPEVAADFVNVVTARWLAKARGWI